MRNVERGYAVEIDRPKHGHGPWLATSVKQSRASAIADFCWSLSTFAERKVPALQFDSPGTSAAKKHAMHHDAALRRLYWDILKKEMCARTVAVEVSWEASPKPDTVSAGGGGC